MNNKVSIVLVNYNCKAFVDECITSLQRQSYANIEVIVVDNSAGDGTAEYINAKYPEVNIVDAGGNVGFGCACNIGAEHAMDGGADYVLFLNFDTAAEPDLVEILVNNADDNTVVTPLIYKSAEKGIYWYLGGEIDRDTLLVSQDVYSPEDKNPKEVGFVTGCCMLVHRAILEKVGKFDPAFFLYYEDVDLCIRWQKSGVNMKYIPEARLFHHEGGTMPVSSEMTISQYYSVRNRLYLAEKHKDYCVGTPIDVLKKILIERDFFETPRYKNLERANLEKRGIEDYLKNNMGEICGFEMIWGRGFSAPAMLDGMQRNLMVKEDACIELTNYGSKPVRVKVDYIVRQAHLDHEIREVRVSGKTYAADRGIFTIEDSMQLCIAPFKSEEIKIDVVLENEENSMDKEYLLVDVKLTVD